MKEFNKYNMVFAFIVFVCGYLYWDLTGFGFNGLGVTIFTFIICTVSLIYFKVNSIKLNKRSFIYLVLVLGLAVSFTIFDQTVIRGLSFLLLISGYIYWVAAATGRTLEDRLSAYLVGDGLNHLILVPFSNYPSAFIAIKQGVSSKNQGNKLALMLIGIAVALPVAAVVFYLLLSADAAFAALFRNIGDIIKLDTVPEIILKLVLTVPVWLYLFGLLYGNAVRENDYFVKKDKVKTMSQQVGFAPKVTVYTVLTIFNIIYLVFFVSQLSYLVSAFQTSLPESFSYADYARQGFFQLCAVSVINFFIIASAYIFIKKDPDRKPQAGLRAELILLSLFSLLLTGAAFAKMILYVDSYGLTQLRVYTICFMAALFLIFIAIGARQLIRYNLSRILVSITILVILGVSYGNIDGVIAKYNIQRYESGTLKELDYEALCQLSDGAVPHLYGYYKRTTDQDLKQVLKEELLGGLVEEYDNNGEVTSYDTAWEYVGTDFRQLNYQRYKAEEIRLQLKKDKTKVGV